MTGVVPMSNRQNRRIRRLSDNERREAIEEELDWIENQKRLLGIAYTRRMIYLDHQRDAALAALLKLMKGEGRKREEDS